MDVRLSPEQRALRDSAAQMQFAGKPGFLYAALALVVASLLVAWWLKRSRYGAWLQAVRDNEDSAAALGVNVFRVKLGAIAISGALMAAGGAFYLQYYRYIDPHIAYGPAISVEALLAAIGDPKLPIRFMKHFGIERIEDLPVAVYADAVARLEEKKVAPGEPAAAPAGNG